MENSVRGSKSNTILKQLSSNKPNTIPIQKYPLEDSFDREYSQIVKKKLNDNQRKQSGTVNRGSNKNKPNYHPQTANKSRTKNEIRIIDLISQDNQAKQNSVSIANNFYQPNSINNFQYQRGTPKLDINSKSMAIWQSRMFIRKQNNINVKEQIKKNMQWGENGVKKKQPKIVHFSERASRNSAKINRTIYSREERLTVQNNLQNNYLNVSNLNMYARRRSSNLQKTKIFFLKSAKHSQKKDEKVTKLQVDIINKIQKYRKNPLLTPQRVQAIYECELLQGMKRILGRSQYSKLNILLNDQNQSAEAEKMKKKRLNFITQYFLSSKPINNLERNQDRIKQQRKKVFEKVKL